MTDLKSCPFCGSEGNMEELEMPLGGVGYQANCSNEDCLAYQFLFHSYARKINASEAWNKRYEILNVQPVKGSDNG